MSGGVTEAGARSKPPVITLEPHEEGRANWVFDLPEPSAEPSAKPGPGFVVEKATLAGVEIVYDDPSSESRVEVGVDSLALQLTAEHAVATPANWRNGDDVIIGTAVTNEEASEKFPGFVAQKPYLRVTPQPGR